MSTQGCRAPKSAHVGYRPFVIRAAGLACTCMAASSIAPHTAAWPADREASGPLPGIGVSQLSLSRLWYTGPPLQGGPPYGRCMVGRSAGPPARVAGWYQLTPCRVAAPSPALRGRVPGADGRVAPGWEPPAPPPVDWRSKRPLADPGRAAVLPPPRPAALRPPSGPGPPVRDGAAHRPAGEARPLARAARGTPRPGRGPGALADGPGPAARRRGGRRRPCRRRPGGGPGRPPVAPDGTARRLVRPQAPAAQTAWESGKTQDHPGNNVLRVQALLTIVLLSAPYGGRGPARRLAEATPYRRPAGRGVLQDLGGLSGTRPEVAIRRPPPPPRGAALPLAPPRATQTRHQRRRMEHGNSRGKRCRIVQDRHRLWQEGIRALVMDLGCAWHHFRVRLNPWLLMI